MVGHFAEISTFESRLKLGSGKVRKFQDSVLPRLAIASWLMNLDQGFQHALVVSKLRTMGFLSYIAFADLLFQSMRWRARRTTSLARWRVMREGGTAESDHLLPLDHLTT